MSTRRLWAWYAAGAILTLAWKFCKFYRDPQNTGKPLKSILATWFFEASAENSISWITTVGVVWCAGVMVIDKVEFVWFETISKIPAHSAFVFLLGSLTEKFAPDAAKYLLSKLPGGAK